jgi:hypothetical protein
MSVNVHYYEQEVKRLDSEIRELGDRLKKYCSDLNPEVSVVPMVEKWRKLWHEREIWQTKYQTALDIERW